MEAQVEADWEVEIGGGAPVIEADWPGFPGSPCIPGLPSIPGSPGHIDLRSRPERIAEISEAAAFPPLARLLLALNAPDSGLYTSKCDLWQPEPTDLACYIDLLPREGKVFAHRQQAETFCREYVARLATAQPQHGPESSHDSSIALVIRLAIAGPAEGFGITAYLSAKAASQPDAAAAQTSAAHALAAVMLAFVDALPPPAPPATTNSKLQ
jgi:hypothetical protein